MRFWLCAVIMLLGTQMNRKHQLTRTLKGKLQKWEVFQCHSHYCSHQVNGYKTLLIIYLHQSNLIWDNHTISDSTCKNVRSGWRKSSSFMLKTPISSDSRAPPSGLKIFPSEEIAVEVAQFNLAQTVNFATILTPTDLLRMLRKCALQWLSPQLLRLPCKSSWAWSRVVHQKNMTILVRGGF